MAWRAPTADVKIIQIVNDQLKVFLLGKKKSHLEIGSQGFLFLRYLKFNTLA